MGIWNRIKDETDRIKISSGTSEYLDDLIKAVVHSNIVFLTYSNRISDLIARNFFNNVTTENFIHRCYIECCKDAYNNPYFFDHTASSLEFKRNQIIITNQIKDGISRSVRKILPSPGPDKRGGQGACDP